MHLYCYTWVLNSVVVQCTVRIVHGVRAGIERTELMSASYRIPAVEKFDFAKPEEWPRWIRRFERFRQASDVTSKSEEVQVSTLVYSLGDKAEDILASFNLTDEEQKKLRHCKREV